MDESNNQIAVPKDELVGRFFAERKAFQGYAYNLTWDSETAQDIFQEACLKFLRMPASFPSFPYAAKYFYKILFSLAVAHQKKRFRLVYSNKLPEMVCEPEPQWQEEMMIERLHELTASLSDRERELLTIHVMPGLRLQEKSNLMQSPLSTYRYQVDRVISKLKKRLVASARPRMAGRINQIGGN